MRLGRAALTAALLCGVAAAGCERGEEAASKPALTQQPKPGKVLIDTNPAVAAVLHEGKRLGQTPLTLERPAFTALRLQLVKDGFRPQWISVIVEPGETKRVQAQLRVLQGHLLVRTGIMHGARLYVDDEDRGRVPCKVAVPAGRKLKLRLEQQGFNVHREELTLKAGEMRQVDVYLVRQGQKAVPTGWISVRSNRPAAVYADKLLLGRTPIKRRRLPARRYKLTLRSQGVAPKVLNVQLKADAEEQVEAEF